MNISDEVLKDTLAEAILIWRGTHHDKIEFGIIAIKTAEKYGVLDRYTKLADQFKAFKTVLVDI